MFTGIVQAVGRVVASAESAAGRRLTFELAGLADRQTNPGDSIAVNGACLTVAGLAPGRFSADLSPETLGVTTLGELVPGSPVNLEPALTLAEPLGGHLVTGHVDGVARVTLLRREGDIAVAGFTLPEVLMRYVARKGSLCVDGVSLTVNDISGGQAIVTLVPHTLGHTIMQFYAIGSRVNIEVDLVARYVERLLGKT